MIDKSKLEEIDDNFSESRYRPNKQKIMVNDIKKNIDGFVNEFNMFFYEVVFGKIVDEIEHLLEEKHNKKLIITSNYNNQIKEMEFLMASGNFIFI
jgi:hypothetical protein